MIDFVVGSDEFAEKIAQEIGAPFVKLERIIFPNREVKPTIKGQVRGHVLFVNRTGSADAYLPNDFLIESYLTIKNLKLIGAGKITFVCPWFVYGKQDKVFLPGEPISATDVIDMLKFAGADYLITITPHMQRAAGELKYGSLRGHCLSAFPVVAEYIKNNFQLNNPLVIGPDLKAEESSKEVAKVLGLKDVVFEKKRDLQTGEITIEEKIDVSGRDVLIVDDFTDQGGTLVKAIKICKAGGAGRVLCAVAHATLVGSCLEKIKNAGGELITTNTIPSEAAKIDVTDLIADFLKRAEI